MTLHFSETAHDCQVVKYLAPLVLAHFDYIEGRWIPKTDYTRPSEKPAWAVTRLLGDLEEFLPAGTYWDRTRRRLRTLHSIEAIRRDIRRYLDVRAVGLDCIQYRDTCPHPMEPQA